MSAFPPQLWQPTEKDRLTTFAPRTFFRRASIGAAAIPVQVGLSSRDVAQVDEVVIVRHIAAVCSPGAAQVCNALECWLSNFGAVVNYSTMFFKNGENTSLTGVVSHTWTGEVVLLPVAEDGFAMLGLFSGNVAVNTVSLSVSGIVIPRGNWQLGDRAAV